MSKEALAIPFYYNKDGFEVKTIRGFGNCLTKNIYFVLSDQFKYPEHLYKIFFEDSTFGLIQDSNRNIIGFKYNFVFDANSYVTKNNINLIEGNAEKAFTVLKNLLDWGYIVFASSITKRLPFYNDFMEESPDVDEKMTGGHIFLLLHYEDDNFYYMENILNNVKKHFTPYEHNKSIGIIHKNDLFNAFNIHFSCFTIEPDIDQLGKIDENVNKILDDSIENYYKPETKDTKNNIISSGRCALQELINICDRDNTYLNQPCNLYTSSMVLEDEKECFALKIRRILDQSCHSRKVSKYLLSKQNVPLNPSLLKIVDMYVESIKNIDTLKGFILKEHLKGDYLMGFRFKKFFEKMLDSEDRLFEMIKANKDLICSTFEQTKS